MAGFKSYEEVLDYLKLRLDSHTTPPADEFSIKMGIKILDSPRLSRDIANGVYLNKNLDHVIFSKGTEPKDVKECLRIVLSGLKIPDLSPKYQLKLVKNPLYDHLEYQEMIFTYILNIERLKTGKQPLSLEALEIAIKKDKNEWWAYLLIQLQDLAAKGKFPGFVR